MNVRASGDAFALYDGRYGPISESPFTLRPSLIFRHHNRRQAKIRGLTLEAARQELSAKTGISISRICQIETGGIPSSVEIRNLHNALGWSIFFIFGISKNAYEDAEQTFFDDLELTNPTTDDRRAYREFYGEFLEIVSSEARGVRK